MKASFVLILLISIACISCEEMVTNVDVPASEPHYVMHAYLSPEDSMVTVSVGRSTPVFGEQNNNDTTWINTARVFVNGVELSREPGGWKFSEPTSLVPIHAGQSYEVELYNGSTLLCSANCLVPSVANQSLVFEGIDSVQYSGDYYYEYYAKWAFTDLTGSGHYYRIGAEISVADQWSSDTVTYQLFPEVQDFIRDLDNDGQRFSGRVLFLYGEYSAQVTDLKLTLYTTDEMYYFYHRAVLSQNGDDPFSEPVIVSGNVDGGLGCVAAYRIFEYDVW